MSNIIPFESGSLPAYLKGVNREALNDDLVSGGPKYGVISIKGKVFATTKNGERKIIPNPLDPNSPATSIDVVILKANPGLSKLYYAKKFVEGSDEKPDCSSTDGVTPASDAAKPQSKACGTCPHNAWGSRTSDDGRKGKACQDSKRIAVATPTQLNEPYLIRVPPASLTGLTEHAQHLAKRGVKYNMVVTKIAFDPEAATPKLLFKPVGFLDEAGYNQVQEVIASDAVQAIIGGGNGFTKDSDAPNEPAKPALAAPAEPAAPSKSPTVQGQEVDAAIAAAAVVAKAASPAQSIEVDLSDLKFDD